MDGAQCKAKKKLFWKGRWRSYLVLLVGKNKNFELHHE